MPVPPLVPLLVPLPVMSLAEFAVKTQTPVAGANFVQKAADRYTLLKALFSSGLKKAQA